MAVRLNPVRRAHPPPGVSSPAFPAPAPSRVRAPLAALGPSSVATRLSGLAMWPTLVLDDAPGTLVRSRGANGEAQKSHWQTVLKLLSDTPLPVTAGAMLPAVARSTMTLALHDSPASSSVASRLPAATVWLPSSCTGSL